jgi:CheY-like chemotaxis protein
MQELPKLQTMLEKALAQAASECGMLLGHELAVGEAASRQLSRDDYFGALENASFVVGIESKEEYQGTFHLVFALRDAIVLSSLLLGVPPARIQEKKRLAIIEEDDVDAFSEIANQVTGSFNAVFKPSLPKKVHLKQLTPKKFIPGKDTIDGKEPIVDGDYYLLQVPLQMAGHDLEQVDLLIPLQLARLFDLQNGEGAEEEAASAPSPEQPEESGAGAPRLPSVLILEDNDAERQQFRDILAASGVGAVDAPLSADLKKVLEDGGVKAVLVGIDNSDDQELSLCFKVKSQFREVSVPIIVCARQWTRSGVLKALKYGARDILLKPCPPEELTAKVMKLMVAV